MDKLIKKEFGELLKKSREIERKLLKEDKRLDAERKRKAKVDKL